MDAYDVCQSCACHIKRHETNCPFCGAGHRSASRKAVRPSRMSRGQWLAFGSTLAVVGGCSGAVDPVPPSGGNTGQVSGMQPLPDASFDAPSTQPGDDASSTPVPDGSVVADTSPTPDASQQPDVAPGCNPSGSFACNPNLMCDSATQYCSMVSGGGGIACESQTISPPFPAECAGCPTCDCISAHLIANCHCTQMGEGVGIECAGCYGSPPARLERMATSCV
jgi:hypothetical protein